MLIHLAQTVRALLIGQRGVKAELRTEQLPRVQDKSCHGGLAVGQTVLGFQLGVGQVAVGIQVAEDRLLHIGVQQSERAGDNHLIQVLRLADDTGLTAQVLAVSRAHQQCDMRAEEGIHLRLVHRILELNTQLLFHQGFGRGKPLIDLLLDALMHAAGALDEQLTSLGIGEQLLQCLMLGLQRLDGAGDVAHVGTELCQRGLAGRFRGCQRRGNRLQLLVGLAGGNGGVILRLHCLVGVVRLDEIHKSHLQRTVTGHVHIRGAADTGVAGNTGLDKCDRHILNRGNGLTCIGDSLVLLLSVVFRLVVLVIQNLVELLVHVALQLVGVGDAHTAEERMGYDGLALDVLQDGVQLVVQLDHILLPDVIADGVVMAELVVVLQNFGVLVGQDEVGGCAVLDRLQLGVLHVAFHIQRGAGKFHVAVQHDAEERHAVAGTDIAAGIQRCVQDMPDVLPGVDVTAVHHDIQRLVAAARDILQCTLDEGPGILAVVRLVVIEVGVECGSQRADRDAGHVVQLVVLLHELLIEVAEVCGRDGKLVVADILLHGRAVLALAGVPVVDGLDHVLAQRQTVKHTGLVDIREVEVRENAQIAVLQLGGIVQQLLHGGILGHCLLPLEIVRHLGVHTAVGKAGQLEVDVGDALLGKILIHGDDVCRRSHGTLDRDRDRGDLLGGLHGAEGLDVQGDIAGRIGGGQLAQQPLTDQVIPVGERHAEPGRVIPLAVLQSLFLCDRGVGQQDVVNLEVTGILPVGDDRPLGVGTDRDGVRQVVGVLRAGVEVHHHGVVLGEHAGVIVHDVGQGVTLLDNGGEAALGDDLLNLGSLADERCEAAHAGGRGLAFLLRLGDGIIHHTGDARHGLLTQLVVVLKAVIVPGILHDTERGIAHGLLVGTGQLVVRVVHAVHLARHGGRGVGHILHGKQRTGAVGAENIAVIGIVAATHVGQDADAGQLVQRLVEGQTVDGQADGKAVLAQRVLQRHLEDGRIGLGALVLGELMVIVHLLVGVIGSRRADHFLLLLNLRGGRGAVEHPEFHIGLLLQNRVGLDELFLQGVGLLAGNALHAVPTAVVGDQLAEREGHGRGILRLGHAALTADVQVLIQTVVLQHGAQQLLTEAGVLDDAGDKVSCLLTSDDVLHADTVLDVLDGDLVTHGGVLIAVEFSFLAVVRVLDDDLRQQLVLDGIGRVAGADVVGVGEQNLTCRHIPHRHLTAGLVAVQLIVALLELALHGGELGFRRFVHIGQVIDLLILFGCSCSRAGLRRSLVCRNRDRKSGQNTAQHQNSQKQR